MNGATKLAVGIAATLAVTGLYHGPLGGGDRVAARIEGAVRAELDRQEMRALDARLQRRPLRRVLVMRGPADDFQRRELTRILGEFAGVADIRWDAASLAVEAVAR